MTLFIPICFYLLSGLLHHAYKVVPPSSPFVVMSRAQLRVPLLYHRTAQMALVMAVTSICFGLHVLPARPAHKMTTRRSLDSASMATKKYITFLKSKNYRLGMKELLKYVQLCNAMKILFLSKSLSWCFI